ncbi:MAG: lactonase family protein, partial [bacterium]|nr:lactonase family protein [bacterium]
MRTSLAILAVTLVCAGCGGPSESPTTDMTSSEEYFVYFGTSGKQSDGIHAARFDPATGKLTPLGLAVEADAPGFLEIHPDGKRLYAVGRSPADAAEPWQGVAAYEIDHATGKLTFLNRADGKGAGPCHVTVDSAGRTVAVANYSGGSIASMKI